MADQVSLSGSLAAGVSVVPAGVSRPPSVQEKPSASGSSTTPAPAAGSPSVSAGAASAAAESFNAYLQQHQQELVFQVDQTTGQTVFRIVNAKTKEVVRQVPAEDILIMAQKLRELDHSKGASGVLVDKVG